MNFWLLLLSVLVNSKVCVFHCCSLGVNVKNGFPVERKKGRIRCICGATSEKDWDILAMLAACQVNKTLMEKVFVRS